jgi:hypothetical protein
MISPTRLARLLLLYDCPLLLSLPALLLSTEQFASNFHIYPFIYREPHQCSLHLFDVRLADSIPYQLATFLNPGFSHAHSWYITSHHGWIIIPPIPL